MVMNVHPVHSDRGDILETNIGETAVHASIESIDVLLAVGAEDVGRAACGEWNG